jgi:hypothetical protein
LSTLSVLSKFQRRGVASECSEAADPEREDHPDLLGEEAGGGGGDPESPKRERERVEGER